ncbi:MAG: arsenate reductase family protein [Weeksellaceae bacterium]|nr:arsenate reductase family protein [Weeksellaceae bacterium]
MKKVFYLKTCDTCRKILGQYDTRDWEMREIKINPITEQEVEDMYQLAGSYEALFNKKSNQIKLQELDPKALQEKDYKELLLDHYTYLKRPVFLTEDEIFIGSDKINLGKLKEYFLSKKEN